ncbi:YtxH domain-containing protein [Oceanobacillus manasiensis]|uniref:YtxH domain-containing protein n=1 Tax=Oceanobacillus manasiensis TaxID=586413 RepID=UPI0005A6DD39|nr:YtxH domain-containing protein [Oceanobacillus manasiensis]
MGNRKLVVGVLIGALVGGAITLFDRETRNYSRMKLTNMKYGSQSVLRNPSEAVRNVRKAFNTFNQNFSTGAQSTINALEQVEATLDKYTNKNQTDRIE